MINTTTRRGRRESGTMLVASVILLVTMSAFSLLLVSSAQSSHKEVSSRLDATKAFYVAEGGLDLAMSQMNIDTYWPVSSTTRFPTVNGSNELESDWITLGDDGGSFKAYVSYMDTSGVAMDVSNRTSTPAFETIQVRVTGRHGDAQRSIRARLSYEITGFDGAIVSDAPLDPSASGSGKSLAIDSGVIVFDTKGTGDHYVYGEVHANGGVFFEDSTAPLTTANKDALLTKSTGAIKAELEGTADEIPDFTDPGSSEQLFEFGRFEAAAAAGAGKVYESLSSFVDAVNVANTARQPLEGISYVKIDAAVEGKNPKLRASGGKSGEYLVPDGINILGTLVFDFSNVNGDDFYKVFIECPLNINPGALGADFDPADPDTFATGYPPTLTASKDPRGFAMNHATYEDFPANADMPALMFDTGTVDIHQETNVCGAVYGPSFIEIENQAPTLQYFNGIIIGGAGIYLKSPGGTDAAQVFVYDSSVIDKLPTFRNRGKSPKRSGYLIDE